MTTYAVAKNSSVTIKATYKTSSQSATLAVTAPNLVSVTLNDTTVTGDASVTGTATISSPAPSGGLTIDLSSSFPSLAKVPATVVIPSGKTTQTFTISTEVDTSNVTVTITAGLNGSSSTVALTIRAPLVLSVTVSPSPVVGGNSTTGTVKLNVAAPAGGMTIDLTPSDSYYVQVPATVLVPGGKTSATFAITTTLVTGSDYSASVIASVNGFGQPGTFTVQALQVTSISIDPGSMPSGSKRPSP